MHQHRFYLPPADATGDQLQLDGREAHHAIHVLRLKRGDDIIVLDGAGNELSCRIETVSRDALSLRVTRRITVPVPREGGEESPSGRQTSRLAAYMNRSTSSPGDVNSSATASSITTTNPSGRTAPRAAASTSTGRGMSCTHSKANAASYGVGPA